MRSSGRMFILVFSLTTVSYLACRQKQIRQDPGFCSYVMADSLNIWCKQKMAANRLFLKDQDTIRLVFNEDDVSQLWQTSHSDSLVRELGNDCGFGWLELPAKDGNRFWQLSLPFEKTDSTYIVPNNLLTYLFSK